MKLRNFLYKFARFLGDAESIKRNRIGKRIMRRIDGKGTGRILRKLFG